MSTEDRLRERAQRAIEEKVFPGCVIGIVRANDQREVLPFGYLAYESDAPEVSANTIYDLASITKSIPTASLALLFAAADPPRLNLGGRVVQYLPEFQNDHGATIEDLLRYRVRGPRMSELRYKTFEEIRTHIFEHGFDGPPGDPAYTNLPAFLLGIILERVGGEILPALAHRYFFEPLKMNDTTFFPAAPDTSNSTGRQSVMRFDFRVAPTEIVCGVEVRGIVHDESARMFAKRRRAVGHAGLFSTAPDLLNFLEAVLKGEMGSVREGAERGLGWQVSEEWMGKGRSAKSFGKTGFTGTSIVCDTEQSIGFVILSNRTYPHRPPDTSAINSFRADIAGIIFR